MRTVTCRGAIKREAMCSPDDAVTQNVEVQVSSEEQKQVNPPSIWETIASWGVNYMHIPSEVKIGYYFITLLMLSLVKESIDVPHIDMLTGKHSVLNTVFVKKGWGITLIAFVVYHLTSLPLHPKWMIGLKQLLIRIAATTFFFFIWCAVVFEVAEQYSEVCTFNNIKVELTKRQCLKLKDHVYYSFDISGHSFLTTYCVLIMMEESKEILYFLWLGKCLRGIPTNTSESIGLAKFDEKDTKILHSRYTIMSPIVVVSFVCIVLLCLIWDFMFIITTLYYHNFLEKVIGTILAVSTWYFLYRQLFTYVFKHKFFLS
ncbi:acyl-coenzyme A diphosphatase FITM2 [Procambarus clarkii]|uniref:acyl-coenzyme A diphosphatase FITM2 n=1 Tax=Procambarus clarkii TaxID=6728 RepID=UPI001E6751C5|nr:acyl-coenzyme A diphosphatase FITM2-like [Procambarus clarkii]